MLIPRPHQIEGILFLKSHKKACNWDLPGLGKTLQAALAANTPCLIAAPTYLTEQWADVIEMQFPGATIALAQGSKTDRQKLISAKADWTIINIEMFRTYEFDPNNYSTLIVDEAHHCRGHGALQSKAMVKLANKIEYVYLLTATPIKNEADDMYMQLKALDPKRFSSYNNFVQTWCIVVKTPYDSKVIGVQNPQLFANMLSQYGIRRSYKDAGRLLPEAIPHIIKVEPDEAWLKSYQKIRDQYILEELTMTSAVQVFNLLRQFTLCKAKVDALVNILEDIPKEKDLNGKLLGGAVIFTWYKETAKALGRTLNCPVITGGTRANDRRIIAGENHTVVANIAALTEGVDLSDKNTVVFFEEDYTPGGMDQAVTRVVRERKDKNREDPVNIYYVMLDKTIDIKVHSSQSRKQFTITTILAEELSGKRS